VADLHTCSLWNVTYPACNLLVGRTCMQKQAAARPAIPSKSFSCPLNKLCRHAVEACLSSLLSASLSKEAAAAERMAALEGSLASLAAASASAQAALAEATNKGEGAMLLACWPAGLQHTSCSGNVIGTQLCAQWVRSTAGNLCTRRQHCLYNNSV
jgi:hypothetical protein